jgi:ABC-type transporter Mla subunit MlaD
VNRRNTSIAANPVLIGAATVLVIVVAVFLAYNANNGLPFVPTYELKAEVPDAANLVTGNEVRIGGDRVGIISAIEPIVRENGDVGATLTLKLEEEIRPLPVDTELMIRPRSSLGLKYLELRPGRSDEGFEEGATIPMAAARPEPVEIDEFFNMFDEPTREAQRVNLREFGNALAGRGRDINDAIVAFDPLTRNAIPVLSALADPSTGLARFFRSLQQTASAVAPVAREQSELFDNLATTFDAFAAIARPYLQDSIAGGPPALEAAIRSLPEQRAFIASSTELFEELQPGMAALRESAPLLADAFTIGTRTVRSAASLNRELARTMTTLQQFAEDPQVPIGIDGLRGTVVALAPTVGHLWGAQVNCNYLALLFNNAASMLSDGDRAGQGTWLRGQLIAAPIGPNSEVGPASTPADGPETNNHLHSNPYPRVGAPGQNGTCMAGNEPYAVGRTTIGNPAGRPTRTARVPSRLNDFPD